MSNSNIEFIVNLSKLNSILNKDLDGKLGGIGLTDFMVLYHLDNAKSKKLRRIDLADKVGLTASGITRLLLPMEKIGLVNKELDFDDARVSIVSLTTSGKRVFKNATKMMDEFLSEIIPKGNKNEIKSFTKLTKEIGGKILWD